MTEKERQYLVDRGLIKSRYQQRSSRLRDENNAMKVREQETGIKLTQPAKQVKTGTGSTKGNTRQRLLNAQRMNGGTSGQRETQRTVQKPSGSAKQVLTDAFKRKGR